jgi:uncharacterized membrane-anchored protein YjiN (DUF445 family)
MTKKRNGKHRTTKDRTTVECNLPEPTQGKSLQRSLSKREIAPAMAKAELTAKVTELLAQASGVKETRLGAHIVDQVNRTLALWPSADAEETLKTAVELMVEIKPESAMEAMLATQMVGVHHAALSALERAAFQVKSREDLDAATRVSARLMRLFTEQLEAMAKLKGKSGQQKMTVKHVHVHQGGQVVVGQISTAPRLAGEGGNEKARKGTP